MCAPFVLPAAFRTPVPPFRLHSSPAHPGDGRTGTIPTNPGPWTGPRVKHRQYTEFAVADGLG